jgi:hypothetical protein
MLVERWRLQNFCAIVFQHQMNDRAQGILVCSDPYFEVGCVWRCVLGWTAVG